MILKTEIIKLPIKKERLTKILTDLTNDDFNGKKEDCEKVSVSIRDKEISMSKLESWMFEYDLQKDNIEFLQSVLDDAYANYEDKQVKVMAANKNTIIIAIAYI